MIRLQAVFGLVALALALMVSPHISRSWADEPHVYNTPPSQLTGLTGAALNDFGLKLLTESYDIRSRVGKPTGNAESDQAIVNSDAVKAVSGLYDEDALIQRARLNYGLTKKTYVPNYTGDFTIASVAVSQTSSTVLVISFDVTLPNRTSLQSGVVYSGEAAPRIVVMRWNEAEKMWKIVAHGDFDSPRAFLCGADKDFMPQKSAFKPEDIELARQLFDMVETASLNGTEKSVQSKGFQYVFASGERKTAPGKIRAKIKKRQVPLNVEAIRSDDLLTMRFDTESSLTLDGGDTQRDLRPRLLTFHHDDDGEWRMAAIAIFSVTAKVAEGVKCVGP